MELWGPSVRSMQRVNRRRKSLSLLGAEWAGGQQVRLLCNLVRQGLTLHFYSGSIFMAVSYELPISRA